MIPSKKQTTPTKTKKKKKTTMMIDYFQRQVDLESRYGPRAVVIYQCGGFYEIYEEKTCSCQGSPCAVPGTTTIGATTHSSEDSGRLCGACGCVAPSLLPTGKASAIKELWNVAQPSKDRWWMVGFPVRNAAAYQRYLGVLIRHGWTVAVYDQKDVDPTSSAGRLATKQEKTRVLRRIYSAGTCSGDSGIVHQDSDFRDIPSVPRMTMALYFNKTVLDPIFCDVQYDAEKVHYEIGVAMLEIERGTTSCGSVFTTDRDMTLPFARLRELLSEHEPTELLIVAQGLPASQVVSELRSNGVTLPDDRRVIVRAVNKKSMLPKRQGAVFTKIFACGKFAGIPIAQRLGIACDPCAATALTELLLFVDDHDATLVRNLAAPTVLLDQERLIIHTTSLRQLNIIAARNGRGRARGGAPTSLIDVVDMCVSSEGRKLLRERICRPSTDPAVIRARFDRVDALMTPSASEVPGRLKAMGGLGKLVGRIRTERLKYSHLPLLMNIVNDGLKLVSTGLEDAFSVSPHLRSFVEKVFPHRDRVALVRLKNYLSETFDLKRASHVNARDCEQTSCFAAGINADIDGLVRRGAEGLAYLRAISTSLRLALPPVKVGNRKKRVAVKAQDVQVATVATSDTRRFAFELTNVGNRSRKRSPHGIGSTVAAPLLVRSAIEDCPAEDAIAYPDSDVPPSWSDSTARVDAYLGRTFVTFKWQVPVRDALSDIHRELVAQTQAAFKHSQTLIREQFLQAMESLLTLLAEMDVSMSSANVARLYAYSRPRVLACTPPSGGNMSICGLRHPIIERLDNSTAYVSNDIEFGDKNIGYLVHGVNAAGKSSLMKSVGIAVIMAQAGLFVPATSMSLVPYHQLFTRITKEDDLFCGMSSFQVEMVEVGAILRRADNHSLVIGDELCSGTETTSAVSIVGASVVTLRDRGTHFLFATHLHELGRLPKITSDTRVKSVHMKVDIDDSGVLTYARKLCDGQGPDAYGIESCVGFGLPEKMIELAKEFRSILENKATVTPVKVSKYNSGVLRDLCFFPGCKNPAVDVHHLVHQATTTSGFLIDGRHKNDISNLLPVCKFHHDKFHCPGAPAVGAKWIHTSNGPKLSVSNDIS